MDRKKWATDIELMRVSDRLRLYAELGADVLTRGPVEDDSTVFGTRGFASNMIPSDPSMSDETLRESVHLMHTAGRWAQYGFNVFELTSDLAASFLLTTPAPLGTEELHLPFPCFYIRLPEGAVPVFLGGRQLWAEGVWVHRFKSQHMGTGRSDVAFFRWTVERKGLSLWKDRFPTNLDDPKDESVYNRTWEGDPPAVPEDQISTDKALRVIKNLVSWLDATGGIQGHPTPQPPHIKRKASKEQRKRLDSDSWPRVWVFGQDVKLRPELRQLAREYALSESKDHAVPGWQLKAQHIVRGHWKNQPYGEDRALRKRLWMQPYYRGPEGAEAWAHIYKAGEAP